MRERLLSIQQSMVGLQEKIHGWHQAQAETNQKWESQIQALQEQRHQETLKVGQSEARGTNWQAVASGLAVAVSVAALVLAFWRPNF